MSDEDHSERAVEPCETAERANGEGLSREREASSGRGLPKLFAEAVAKVAEAVSKLAIPDTLH